MNCPHCATPLTADARFCPACGKASAPTESGASWPNAAGATADLVGKTIAGRYRITAKLGEGGMGAVYRGEQMSLKRAVAVKLLRPELSTNQQILQRFNAEAQAVAKLSHPNTVNIYDFGQDTDGSLFIAMEYIEGRSLRSAIQTEGPFPPARAVTIAMQVAASLSDAHAHNIVHRDLKPDNVMLQDRGRQKDVVRVLDFGIAKLRDDSRATQAAMTQAGDMLGTPQYMAPEQIRGEAIDGRTDIYALGCMIYEMVTARLPYEAPTIMAMLSKHLMENPVPPTQRRPELRLPPAIDQLVLSAMAKDPRARPATMEQFAEMLGALLPTLPPDPNRPPSSAMSVQQSAIAAVVTPPAAAFQAPPPAYAAATPAAFTPAPAPPPAYPPSMGMAPPSYVPPPISPTLPVAQRTAPKRSNTALIVVLGSLAIAGGAAGVYFATKKPAPDSNTDVKAKTVDEPDKDDDDDTPDKTDTPEPPANPNQADPWGESPSAKASRVAPQAPTKAGTAKTPIPAGAYIDPPDGFTSIDLDKESKAYVNYQRSMLLAIGPLEAGTNDPKKLAAIWTKASKGTLLKHEKVPSHGASRDMLVFTATQNGVVMGQIIVLYITDSYRLGVLLQAPAAQFTDTDFQHEIDRIYEHNVHLP
ncbi:MAG TPA: protein kinase [Kofleriaceae bacterium]|nr:protein kinase [Kofleriaceae bacterium]